MIANEIKEKIIYNAISTDDVAEIMKLACKKIAPLWSLENFVAVNPYLGLTNKKFESVALELAKAGNIQMTLPTDFYLKKLDEEKIKESDLLHALLKNEETITSKDFIQLIKNRKTTIQKFKTSPLVADAATTITEKDWNRFIVGRISVWAASYFDVGQASWKVADSNQSIFMSWKTEAEIALTAELTGVKNFRKLIKAYPNDPIEAAQKAMKQLNIPHEGMDAYLHRLLLNIGGWAAYAARLDWESQLYGGKDGQLIEFLAILLCWEAILIESFNDPKINSEWDTQKKLFIFEDSANQNKIIKENLILQEAFEKSAQRELLEKFQYNSSTSEEQLRPAAQAIFCIDVRSEVYRRNLEMVNSKIDTMGFAGFFAFPIKFIPLAHQVGEAQCPVLLPTGPTILEKIIDEQDNEKAIQNRILNRQIQKVWKSFKSSAVSCFSFVSPIGLSYLPKLFTDSFGYTRPVPHPDKNGLNKQLNSKKSISLSVENFNKEVTGIPLEQQVQMAKNALTAMSLTDNFAEFVLIVGHGATMVNNPHATGYDCGACGGHTGDANAKVAASVLNNAKVRFELIKEHIFIPEDTLFLACLHDTTTDEISIYNENEVSNNQNKAFQNLKSSLSLASKSARAERAIRLVTKNKKSIDSALIERSKDWSQIRPEWGLAGCSAFIVAPRERTKNINLEGKSFLHSYDWKKDKTFGVLELIMTAPMVVTTWINLQYYGSTVDNKNYGSGNKTLHNVTAGIGVLEGYSGDLRQGLPLQSIHDGEKFQHEPLKLSVIIEAPIAEMNKVLEKHSNVKELCDNEWMYLFAMNEEGKITHQYDKNLSWKSLISNVV